MRAVAKKHVVVFLTEPDTIRIIRIVHGALDLEALASDLEGGREN
jgi:plasmid stabilization system protein ParE